MKITKEYLLNRKAGYGNLKEKHIADANACAGAIEDINKMLADLEKPEPVTEEVGETKPEKKKP